MEIMYSTLFHICTGYVKAEKEALKKVPPSEFFRHETDKYSQFDDKVMVLYIFLECNILASVCVRV